MNPVDTLIVVLLQFVVLAITVGVLANWDHLARRNGPICMLITYYACCYNIAVMLAHVGRVAGTGITLVDLCVALVVVAPIYYTMMRRAGRRPSSILATPVGDDTTGVTDPVAPQRTSLVVVETPRRGVWYWCDVVTGRRS